MAAVKQYAETHAGDSVPGPADPLLPRPPSSSSAQPGG